ncbi:MAG: protein-glutamate O-methyltransferase CheR [Candidatus Riflebacteria bacterium]|nr:protein-glutamate O-methyltransferase CheR [Candidatus Riflebacteria bacterium]
MMNLEKKHIDRIRELVHSYSGIILERVATRNIDKKIQSQMKHFGMIKPDDYILILEEYEHDNKAMDELIAELTVSESYFFRNPDQFEYIVESLLPELYQHSNWKIPARTWSAGCSRGEEAYSLAMTMLHFQQENPKARFSINAGDINSKNLGAAREAVYNKRSLREKLPLFEKQFGLKLGERNENGDCTVSDEIKSLVTLQKLNLKNVRGLNCLAGSDIVFCRNVLIYFDEQLRTQLAEKFYQCLNPGGVVFLGESECFSGISNLFELVSYKKCYAYRKPLGIR